MLLKASRIVKFPQIVNFNSPKLGLTLRKHGARLRFGNQEVLAMRFTSISALAIGVLSLCVMASLAFAQQDKYTVKVPGGLAFSEFRGYESWEVIAISHSGNVMAATLGNPVMIKAFKDGIPANGKPFPDGAKMAKIHWNTKDLETSPGATVPGTQHDADFMVKDSKRFADSGGWGWGAFEYDAASDKFTPATTANRPPQGNDAKCGFACHTKVKADDYVFTKYAHR
jgi:Cytochrome P460